MKIMSTFAIVLAVSIFCFSADTHASSYVPVSHRIYDFLERMEHHYFISGAYLGIKPATRSQIADLLIQIKKNENVLTVVDKEEYDCLLAEFLPDISVRKNLVWDDKGPVGFLPKIFKPFIYRNRRNLFSKSGDSFSLYVDPVINRSAAVGISKSYSKDDRVYIAGNGFILRGTAGEHIGFYIDVRDSKEWGSRDYPVTKVTTSPGRGYVSFKGDRAEFDETHAHIAYTNGPFTLSFGRGKNIWGYGKTGTLGLSGYASPYDMVRIETGFWKLKFMFFAAEIEQYPPIAKFYYNISAGVPSDSVTVKKHISGHRVEMNFTDRLKVGLYETVIYGGRWDLSYLNPVMFLTGAEHTNGDHDNAAMGIDFRLFVHKNHSLYGELFIDDISMQKLGTDWYGNKFAYQAGTFIVEPFGLRDVDARIEYSHISPWVYTHKFPVNGYHHYGDVLGYPSGPNSDVVFFQVRKRLTRRFHTGCFIKKQRHGENPVGINIGGNLMKGFKDGDSTKAHFLDGNLEKTTFAGFDVSYEIFWQFFLKLGYTYENQDGVKINIYQVSLGLNE
ncbi:MAG: hypothetical protein JXB48_22695 [Candidatus Latescibacteria bacterium]|nr:hypothetical protein [Candidatus Latescibacterota bacterium]